MTNVMMKKDLGEEITSLAFNSRSQSSREVKAEKSKQQHGAETMEDAPGIFTQLRDICLGIVLPTVGIHGHITGIAILFTIN